MLAPTAVKALRRKSHYCIYSNKRCNQSEGSGVYLRIVNIKQKRKKKLGNLNQGWKYTFLYNRVYTVKVAVL